MKLGTATASRAAAEAWGATVTPVKISDYFTAMERKLVDGIPGCPIDTWVSLGCEEVTKYVLDYQFYQSTATALMNLNSWNKLPDDVKKIMYDTMDEYYVAKMKSTPNGWKMPGKKCWTPESNSINSPTPRMANG